MFSHRSLFSGKAVLIMNLTGTLKKMSPYRGACNSHRVPGTLESEFFQT